MMSSQDPKLSSTQPTDLSQAGIPPEFFLSLATGPLLLGILSSQAVLSWLQTLGIASEEVFRGYSLPVLHFPGSVPEE
ncbi:MAG: hypothetical protein WA919_16705 [Coleofasciculaceae cyanobacterium]